MRSRKLSQAPHSRMRSGLARAQGSAARLSQMKESEIDASHSSIEREIGVGVGRDEKSPAVEGYFVQEKSALAVGK